MPFGHCDAVVGTHLGGDDLCGVVKKVLVGPSDGWEGWVMRLFELAPGGYTPRHSHVWPHINMVLDGEGTLFVEGRSCALRGGSYALVPSGDTHQFRTTGARPLRFVCIVPREGDV